MVKSKAGRNAVLAILLVALVVCCVAWLTPMRTHAAESVGKAEKAAVQALPSDDNVSEPQGLLTKLSVTIGSDVGVNGANGIVWGRVHNDFTLGYSIVTVYVELYSSVTYQESYTNMTLESRNYIRDLNINESIYTRITTGGETRYWLARMRFKFDDNAWDSGVTDIVLIAADGSLIADRL